MLRPQTAPVSFNKKKKLKKRRSTSKYKYGRKDKRLKKHTYKIQSKSLTQKPKIINFNDTFTLKSLEKERKSSINNLNYERAEYCTKRKRDLLMEIRKKEVVEEEKRQASERRRFIKNFKIIEEKKKKKYENLSSELEVYWETKFEELEIYQEIERNNFEKDFEKRYPKLRYSKLVCNMLLEEENLLKCNMYYDSKNVNQRRKKLQKIEKEKYRRKKIDRKEKEWEAMLKKHEDQIKLLTIKKKKAFIFFNNKRKKVEKKMNQKKTNLLKDIDHSHKLEFIKKREVSRDFCIKAQKRFSSSFFGSNLKSKLRHGKKYKLPSLCDLYL